MAVVTEDQIGADVAATVAAIAGVRGCAYPPPENAPAQGPACWVDLGPIEVQMGSLEVSLITVTVTVATPRKGDYPNEYRLVLATARAIVIAFRANILVAGEAALMAPGVISKPIAARYGEIDPNITACTVTVVVETMVETVNDLAL
jgi:hypothetical protein